MWTIIESARHGCQVLRRWDLLLVVAGIILSAAIGVNAAILGLLVGLSTSMPTGVVDAHRLVVLPEVASFPRYRDASRALTSVALTSYTRAKIDVSFEGEWMSVLAECVTDNYFQVLGAKPMWGRLPAASQPQTEPELLLSHSFWSDRLGGEKTIVGRSVTIARREHRIVGIASRGFAGLSRQQPDVFIQLLAAPAACSGDGKNLVNATGAAWLTTIGRLAPEVPLTQALGELATLGPSAGAQPHVSGNAVARSIVPLVETLRNRNRGERQIMLWMELASLAVLLMACSNAATLFGLRATARRREIAIRFQLGAERSHVVIQLLTEAIVFSGICAIGAWACAEWTQGLLGGLVSVPAEEAFGHRRLILVAGLAAFAGVVIGLDLR